MYYILASQDQGEKKCDKRSIYTFLIVIMKNHLNITINIQLIVLRLCLH